MIVLDASVLLASVDNGDVHHDGSLEVLKAVDDLATYDLCRLEVVNVALRSWKRPEAARRLLARIGAIELVGTIVRIDAALTADILALCAAHPLSAYDAGYVATARRLGGTLVSCDERDLVGPGHAVFPADAIT